MVLGVLLDHVRTPAGTAAACEHRHERRRRQADCLQHERCVELDVRFEFAPWLHLVEHTQHGLLNLARKVTDGEQIRVPREGEEGGTASGLINVNRADATQLEELPGVGPVLAARIIADREANGPFATLDDLARVPGVGDAILGGLEGVATV